VSEDVGGDDVAFVLPDVGEWPDAVDVADGPQVVAGAQVRVDRDPVAIGLDADGLEADALDPRSPAGGDEDAVATEHAPVLELEDVVIAVASRRAHTHAEQDLHAVAPQRLAERLPQGRRLAREHALGPVDE
jgi:hypothetical protein